MLGLYKFDEVPLSGRPFSVVFSQSFCSVFMSVLSPGSVSAGSAASTWVITCLLMSFSVLWQKTFEINLEYWTSEFDSSQILLELVIFFFFPPYLFPRYAVGSHL